MEQQGLVLPEMNEDGQYVVQIKEEYVKTGGHFQAQSFEIEIPATVGIYEKIITFPIGIGLLDAFSHITENMIGDSIECVVGENKIIGVITSQVNIGDNIIHVSPTVMQFCNIGFYMNLFDGVNNCNLGRIIEKNIEDSTIRVELQSTENFNIETPTYVRMSLKIIPIIKLFSAYTLEIGYKKTGTNYIPEGITFTVRYNNINGNAKTFSIVLEYLY
jgi:hypothetical protein